MLCCCIVVLRSVVASVEAHAYLLRGVVIFVVAAARFSSLNATLATDGSSVHAAVTACRMASIRHETRKARLADAEC